MTVRKHIFYQRKWRFKIIVRAIQRFTESTLVSFFDNEYFRLLLLWTTTLLSVKEDVIQHNIINNFSSRIISIIHISLIYYLFSQIIRFDSLWLEWYLMLQETKRFGNMNHKSDNGRFGEHIFYVCVCYAM